MISKHTPWLDSYYRGLLSSTRCVSNVWSHIRFLHRVSASTTLSTWVTSLNLFRCSSLILSGLPPWSERNRTKSSTILAAPHPVEAVCVKCTRGNYNAHAWTQELASDDIRTFTPNVSLEAQIATIKKFTVDKFLRLNASKCEIIVFKKSFTRTIREEIGVGDGSFLVKSKAASLPRIISGGKICPHHPQYRLYLESQKSLRSIYANWAQYQVALHVFYPSSFMELKTVFHHPNSSEYFQGEVASRTA